MFCEKCGKELPQESTFCENCGAKVSKQEMEIPKILKENPLKNIPKKYLAIGGVGIALLAIFIFAMANRKTVINLNDYVTVSYSGYDTMGKATAHFDEEAILKDYKDKIKFKDKESVNEIFEPAEYICNLCVSGALNEVDDLSNGQQITYSWKCEDEEVLQKFGCKLKYEDITFTVEGLGSYVTSLKQIPEDILGKMKQQAEDNLQAHVANNWNEHEKLEGMTYMGCYLLVAKNSNNKKPGRGKITIKGINGYTGSVTKNFDILPKRQKIKKLTNVSGRKLKVSYTKDSTATGYEIQISPFKTFFYDTKTVKVKGKKNSAKNN